MQAAGPTSLITLTTDFGLSDHYVGTMKGVILSRCPGARLVDISHDIAAFSLFSAAYTIDQAAPFYPPGTIHLVVIDPGVGTSRRAVLVEALRQYFVAPDNGVLSMIVARDPKCTVWEITNRSLWLDEPSSTFHGRDLFAPVAAALANGTTNPSDVGPLAEGLELLSGLDAQELAPRTWQGRVLSVDRFGNVVTNFRAAQFKAIASQAFKLRVDAGEVTRWNETFGTAKPAECFAYFGSSGFVEVGINQASAAAFLKASPGDSISLQIQALPANAER
jgi:S-adenosylmethionine hydrolase